MTVLDEILAHKRREVTAAADACPLARLREAARDRSAVPGFEAALRRAPVAVIAEVKRRSPSAGPIRAPFDPAAIARAYAEGGAQAVSVLMDARYFGGGAGDFRAVRAAVALPLLYKEFVVDGWQVWHAAALGASALLLIAGALAPDALRALLAEAAEARVEALVEAHDEAELDRALAAGATRIGINNRDLRTFRTDIETTLRLAGRVPPDRLLVSESGIRSGADVARLRAAGVHAVLVGEHLLRQPDPAAAVRELKAI